MSRVLGLYRRCLRLGRTWRAKEPLETEAERQFIVEEAKRLFRENKAVSDPVKISEHVREAEARLAMAEHYRNPYPRPVNLPPRSFVQKEGKRAGKAIQRLNQLSKPIYVKSIDDASVAEAKK